MKVLSPLGRFIFAGAFILIGVIQLLNAPGMSVMIGTWPTPEIWVYLSGFVIVLAGISMILNIKARLATLLLALLLLIIIIVIDIPMAIKGGQMDLTSALIDVALLGTCLTYSGILKK